MKQLTPFIIASLILLLSFQTGKPSVKPSPGDTVTVKIYRMFVTPDELDGIADTIGNIIMKDYGIELGGSLIRDRQMLMTRQLQRLTSRLTLDSVRVVNGKIVK